MQTWTRTLIEAEDSLRKLEESIHLVRTAWPAADTDANGPTGQSRSTPESLRQLASDLGDIMSRCAELPRKAISAVESAWENLEANELPDWDAVGRQVLELLIKQAEATAQAAKLVQKGKKSGLFHSQAKLAGEESSLRERAREFLDSWPWSTGNKPGDEEDAAAAQRALQALPSFEVLSRMAKNHPPAPEWVDED